MGVAFDRVITALDTAGRKYKHDKPNHVQASCPGPQHKHGDRNPSLSISNIEGQVLLHCHAGCDREDILAALGLTDRDLFDRDELVYQYEDGREVHRTWRKKIWQSSALPRSTLYRLSNVRGAVADGRPVFFVEGEKDVHSIESQGEVGTTAPQGAESVGKCDLTPLFGGQVIVVVDDDAPGEAWAHQLLRRLRGRVRSIDFTKATDGLHDVSDHIAAGHSLDELMPWWPPAEEEPPPDELPEDTPQTEEQELDLRFIPGDVFILDTDLVPRALWGDGEQVLWADGEALIIAGGQGLGKTTLAQQITLGWMGLPRYAELLGYPIEPGRRILYLAMDRPRQAARSFRRMTDEQDRPLLREHLVVWQGPPPGDIAKYPSLLLHLCDKASADAVIVDSLKDAAIGLSEDDVGAGYNRARQLATAAGVQVIELHHVRKAQNSKKNDNDLGVDDLYGSTWITSGAGSVILLTGKSGDPIVKMRHIKQPMAEVGPFSILHNDMTGRSTLWHSVDLLELARATGQITALDAAKALNDTDSPDRNEKEKARRRLDSLAASGHLWVLDPGDIATRRPKVWCPK